MGEAVYFVGMGASAGGLQAIESFITHVPENSGLAYIIVQHLSPDYKSLMVELLSKKTKMQVLRAENNMKVLANHVYLIPPRKNLTIFHGKLILKDQDRSSGVNLPIDIFFRSLAEDQKDKAVGIILSGTGSDGTRGVRSIKDNNGLVIVQSEESAKFSGMPLAAYATGLADYVLAPEDMPKALLAYVNHPHERHSQKKGHYESNDDSITKIFAELRDRSKVDFTYYKPSTIQRRIERRMAVCQVADLDEYVQFIYEHPSEVNTLYKELLIGVTSFFRDPESMARLMDEHLPKLLKADDREEMRVWVAGCSTGEEAYSLAILLKEAMENLKISRDIKIFATDIDKAALQTAGAGVYPESITADLNPKLLTKYFYRKGEHYQIARNIREMIVFARHNLVEDPPFTNIDLVSCRNLLIYLQPVLQQKALQMFNFSLREAGILFLGSSESIGEMHDYFTVLDSKHKFYESVGRQFHLKERSLEPGRHSPAMFQRDPSPPRNIRTASFRKEQDILFRFLELIAGNFIQSAVIVNSQLEVIYILGETEHIFKVPSGHASYDISQMARKDLAIPLTTGVQKVLHSLEPIQYSNLKISYNGRKVRIDLSIQPFKPKKGHENYAAVFVRSAEEERPEGLKAGIEHYDIDEQIEQRIEDLESDLQFTKENLQATIEELETSNEELQATNEELLASNEELQSTNEELQSTNEELYTVNSEYQDKINELTELNNDVDNLLTSSQIGKLIIDENLKIRRYSPEVLKLFMIVESDIGRPLMHIAHKIVSLDIIPLIEKVMKTNEVHEEKIETREGSHFLMRILPYHISPRSFAGTVITFVDISEILKAQQDLKESHEINRLLYETMTEGVVFQNADGMITACNKSAEDILGLSFDQMQGRTSMDPAWRAVDENGKELPGDRHPAMVALKTGRTITAFTMGVFNPKKGGMRWININAVPRFEEGSDKPVMVYATFNDITDKIEKSR